MSDDKPKMWVEMTDAEKGALLLAHHEGRAIELYEGGKWRAIHGGPAWASGRSYRVQPAPKKVRLLTAAVYGWRSEPEGECGTRNTHRITFDVIEGEPDCASIRMEKLR